MCLDPPKVATDEPDPSSLPNQTPRSSESHTNIATEDEYDDHTNNRVAGTLRRSRQEVTNTLRERLITANDKPPFELCTSLRDDILDDRLEDKMVLACHEIMHEHCDQYRETFQKAIVSFNLYAESSSLALTTGRSATWMTRNRTGGPNGPG